MKRVDKSRTQIPSKRPGTPGRKDQRPQRPNGSKPLNAAQLVSRVLDATSEQPSLSVSDSTTGSDSSEFYDNLSVHYVDDSKISGDVCRESNGEESDSETNKDSVLSSQGDFLIAEDEKPEKIPRVSKIKSSPDRSRVTKDQTDRKTGRSKSNMVTSTPKKSNKVGQEPVKATARSAGLKAQSKAFLESSETTGYRLHEDVKEDDVWEDALNRVHTIEIENEEVNESGGNGSEELDLCRKIEDLQTRVDKLEEELRQVAALETWLYSVVQEHGSSEQKLHTPARQLSRLYIHACKNWNKNRLKTVAGNIVSGFVLVAKSCVHDISRLSFWLSNMVAFREIVTKEFDIERNGRNFTIPTLGSKQFNGFMQLSQDWHETGAFLAALEEVESWIFSQTVESVWSQVLTPCMQSLTEDLAESKISRKSLGEGLNIQQKGSFSLTLWNKAFQEVLRQLCPVRATRHDCGCLPVLARLVVEQCIARLDVAKFNAILRESAHQIPSNPVSDPISNPEVLPIPAGDLSFGSGAQLKNTVGNWSRSLTEIFSIDADDSEFKPFCLLNELSDLLMLPKDLLMDRSIRDEVCPSIGLTLIKRILCNFTPDEFFPDPVPGFVLEELNAESIVERSLHGDSTISFPRPAPAVLYSPPSCTGLSQKVLECSRKSQMSKNATRTQKKGYTSDDEELQELDFPLALIMKPSPDISTTMAKNGENMSFADLNERYGLFREVWSDL